MIQECFQHVKGIGPVSELRIRGKGYKTWDDCLHREDSLPLSETRRNGFIQDISRSMEALESRDVGYFVSRFPMKEQWRVMAQFFDEATFFDIETTGLSWHYSHISVIAAFHKGEVLTFVHGRNLDDFLDLLEEARLMVSFNGSAFDVPFIERTFNIPSLGCPHIDLRWVAYHRGYRGGLKSIEEKMNITRPTYVRDIDGLEAVDLYHRWLGGNNEAGRKLICYCGADAVSTYLVSRRLISGTGDDKKKVNEKMLFQKALSCSGK